MQKIFKCHKISPGVAEGEVLISKGPILFYKTDSSAGVATKPGHAPEGKYVKDKVLVFPG